MSEGEGRGALDTNEAGAAGTTTATSSDERGRSDDRASSRGRSRSARRSRAGEAGSDEGGRSGPRAALVLLGIVLTLVLLVAWGAVAAVSAFAAYRDLDQARDGVRAAEAQLRDADLSSARATLATATEHATAASDELHRPWMVPLRIVPVVGPNLRSATVLSDTARDVGTDAGELLEAASVIVHDDRTQEAGEISLAYLGELAPPARRLADTLERTTAEVQELPESGLLGPVERARDQYLETAGANVEQAVVAADLLEVMPTFLGDGEEKTYLLGAASLSEIRASGGLLGSWSTLSTRDGRMEFEEFINVDSLPQTEEAVAPPSEDYARRYGSFDALRQYRNANLTPDFPTAATVLMDIWAQGGGDPVDGVIIATPVAYEKLAERSGGLEVPDHGSFAADEVLQFVGLDAYDAFQDEDGRLDNEERYRVLGDVATAAFTEMFEILEDEDVPATVEMLTSLAAGGHLRIHSVDDSVQPVLERAGVAGELPTGPGESPGLFTNNIAGNKVDWFESRSIDHHVRLLPDGVTDATITATLRNDAPTEGHRRTVLGPWTDSTEAGDNFLRTTFTCSQTCEVTRPDPGADDGGTELGRPMYDDTFVIPAGDQRELSYRTSSRDAWHFDGDRLVLDVDHLVQPTAHGTELTLRVSVPRNTTPLELPEGAEVVDDEVVLTERVSGRVERSFVFDAGELEVAAHP